MKKPIILIVDDVAEIRKTLHDFLEMRYEAEFIEAKDGEKAVEYVKSNPCDLILLDIKMPRKSGITVIKEVKAHDPKIDILVVSSYTSDDVAEEALQDGATDYATKPVNLKVVDSKVKKILAKRGQLISKI